MPCSDCEINSHMWDIVVNEHRYVPEPGDRVLDLGMWHGHFTFYCASRGASVAGYEPQGDVFSEAWRRLQKEPFRESVQMFNRAVWKEDGVSGFFIDPVNSRSSNLTLPSNTIVQTVSLATAVGDADWDCVKADIEGAEHEVFARAGKAVLEKIRYLTLELHNDVLTMEQHDELVQHLVLNFPKAELVEQYAHGKPLGRICKMFCRR